MYMHATRLITGVPGNMAGAQEDESSFGPRFVPPVYSQRYRVALDLASKTKAKTVRESPLFFDSGMIILAPRLGRGHGLCRVQVVGHDAAQASR